jgi:hypothetical protein
MDKSRFRYRADVGKIIWPMITVRPELSFPIVKLSQFSSHPAIVHYDAVYSIFQFLYNTRQDGLTYTRTTALRDDQNPIPPPLRSFPANRKDDHNLPLCQHSILTGYSDSDWVMDSRHRRSISSVVFLLAGSAVAWKTCVQLTASLPTTEAKFLSASDCGRLGLYLRRVLHEMHSRQQHATTTYNENSACISVFQSSHPTRHMRHLAIRAFALQD